MSAKSPFSRSTKRSVDGGPARKLSPSDGTISEAGSAAASEFSAKLALAENASLRERIAKLESSVAAWAADVDESHDENARLRAVVDDLKARNRESEEARDELLREQGELHEAVSIRDKHIAELETRIVTEDIGNIDERRTRSRLVAIRKRARARLATQGEEVEGLRRMLAAGHAARRQVEAELRDAKTDSVRNAKYLDRLEQRLLESDVELGRS